MRDRPLSQNGYSYSLVSTVDDDFRTASRRSSARKKSVGGSPLDVVQFTSPLYFACDDDGALTIEVMRMGALKGEAEFSYSTEDGSAKGGKAFVASSGRICIQDGESSASFQVKLLPCDMWRATVEFKVCLSDPSHCVLGQYLKVCRVKLFEETAFPSDLYSDEDVSDSRLLWEFLKLVYQQDGIGWRSLLFIILGQLDNAYMYLVMLLQIYLVNVALNVKDPDSEKDLWVSRDRHRTAIMVGVLYVLPMFLVHVAEAAQVNMNIPERVRFYLLTGLFRKYMNYTKESRGSISEVRFIQAVTDKTADLSNAYTSMLSLVSNLTRVIMLSFFAFRKCPESLSIVIAMPAMLAVFNLCRLPMLQTAKHTAGQKNGEVAELIAETCAIYNLVAAYFQRPYMNDLLSTRAREAMEVNVPMNMIEKNNDMFGRWLGPAALGIYITVFSPSVIDGTLSLGAFLAMINVINNLSFNFGRFFENFRSILSSAIILRKMSRLYNLETDVKIWRNINAARRQKTKQKREELLRKRAPGDWTPVADSMTLELANMSFQYPTNPKDEESGLSIFDRVDLHLKQGAMYAVTGASGTGKKTFMELLGLQLHPTKGEIFYPTHLRTLFVGEVPMFLRMSIWKNLTFGDHEADSMRVYEICRHLGMETSLAALGNSNAMSDDGGGEWISTTAYTELIKISFVRALIANPEVLVVHRIFDHFYGDTDEQILQAVEGHVRLRGFKMSETSVEYRRPKTCFLTLRGHPKHLERMTGVLDLNEDGGVTLIMATDFEEAMQPIVKEEREEPEERREKDFLGSHCGLRCNAFW